MSDNEPLEIEALIDEVHELRTENERLRSLLGLDQASRHKVTQPWEPTLFAESDPRDFASDINGDSPAGAKEIKYPHLRLPASGRRARADGSGE
jgi:hypothetical protein